VEPAEPEVPAHFGTAHGMNLEKFATPSTPTLEIFPAYFAQGRFA